jgi:aspartyl-tRNA synthetase
MKFNRRTHTCGELRESNIDEKVILNGWVDTRRDLGGVIFVDLRDRYGITQIVFEPHYNADAHKIGSLLRGEYVVAVEGTVRKRPENTENDSIPTGLIDVMVDKLLILNEAKTPPFPIQKSENVNEDIRLEYRYLDLRSEKMQKNLIMRSKMYNSVRNYFNDNGFLEIETPYLMKSTPEGARDFLVPSRVHRGKFYALPQSPQTYKQLLMVSGFDKYFQIVKCFRDEDLRADRQPEFTQIDIEMSFVDQEDIFAMVEGLMIKLFKETKNFEIETPIKRIDFHEAMEKYGSDKPDLRFNLEMKTLNHVFEKSDFRVFRDSIDKNGIITGLLAEGCGDYTRNQLDVITNFVKQLGAGGLIWMRVTEDGLDAPVAKFMTDDEKQGIIDNLGAKVGDLVFIISGPKMKSLSIMGFLRIEIAKRLDLIKPDSKPALLWVTNFPLLEWDEDTKRFYAMHHPFTSPNLDEVDKLETDPASVNARAYDLVLNGNEIAGGSIRIHNQELQSRMFDALGVSKEEANTKFGFLMNAFKFGAPPHGGIAFGFDRLAMLFAGEDSIRDVIAFPKTSSATSLMDDAPSFVDEEQLKELFIKIR